MKSLPPIVRLTLFDALRVLIKWYVLCNLPPLQPVNNWFALVTYRYTIKGHIIDATFDVDLNPLTGAVTRQLSFIRWTRPDNKGFHTWLYW